MSANNYLSDGKIISIIEISMWVKFSVSTVNIKTSEGTLVKETDTQIMPSIIIQSRNYHSLERGDMQFRVFYCLTMEKIICVIVTASGSLALFLSHCHCVCVSVLYIRTIPK